ncbi:MAG: hypothetical protein NTX44_04115 [Ignavibacteriales bacterium]|nr:hypothetical protein [Ignavibacteriales bacterium]
MSTVGTSGQAKRKDKISGWVLLKTYRGLFEAPQFFRTKKKAQSVLKEQSKNVNPDYDEIGIFALSDCVWENNFIGAF